jgi:predicted Zn-dependent protease with MMP-like domain
MVYMEPSSLGFQSLVDSWYATLPQDVRDLFNPLLRLVKDLGPALETTSSGSLIV